MQIHRDYTYDDMPYELRALEVALQATVKLFDLETKELEAATEPELIRMTKGISRTVSGMCLASTHSYRGAGAH